MKACLAATFGMFLCLAGCQNDDTPRPTGTNGTTKNGQDDLPPWNGRMTLQTLNVQELQQLIADQKGKVVVVHLWASWSDATRRGLQELVKVQRRFGDRVAAIAVNTNAAFDSPDTAEAEVRPILEQADARFQNVISTTPDEELFRTLEMPESTFGVIVYNQQGEVAKRFNYAVEAGVKDPFSYERDIVPLVAQLLGK